MYGVIASANSADPIGISRSCQSNPVRGMPIPPSFTTTLGHWATWDIPDFQLAMISSSLLAYGPTLHKPPI